jgi:hypothetical protein
LGVVRCGERIRRLADALYGNAGWQWMQNGEATVSHGWTLEKGFLSYRLRNHLRHVVDGLRGEL